MTKSDFRRLQAVFLKELNDIDPVGIFHDDDPKEYLGEVQWLISIFPSVEDEQAIECQLAMRLKTQFGVVLKCDRVKALAQRLWQLWSIERGLMGGSK